MSYEREILEQLEMPTRTEVEQALLRALLKHGGVIREFSSGQEIVDEIADNSSASGMKCSLRISRRHSLIHREILQS